MDIGWYLAVSAIIFTIGAAGVMTRRNPLVVLLCLELMLNAANLALIAFSRMHGDGDGQVFAIIVMVVAACEVTVGVGAKVAIPVDTLGVDVALERGRAAWRGRGQTGAAAIEARADVASRCAKRRARGVRPRPGTPDRARTGTARESARHTPYARRGRTLVCTDAADRQAAPARARPPSLRTC